MTPFETELSRAIGGLIEEARLSREQRVRAEVEFLRKFEDLFGALAAKLTQKLDAAIAHRDEALREDLGATNDRVTELEKRARNGHAEA